MSFSQRKGLKPTHKSIQLESMDLELRNGLWSAIHLCYLAQYANPRARTYGYLPGSTLHELFLAFWNDYWKLPVDDLPDDVRKATEQLRSAFFNAPWNEGYDIVEFILLHGPSVFAPRFVQECNRVLEREFSAYRFIDYQITPISAPEEVESIDEALDSTSGVLPTVNKHLQTALGFLSDRKNPDYRNSIKESISAVEALARILTYKPKAEFSEAIAILEQKGALHGALKKAFSVLYGYTSDEHGIRHAMLEEPNLGFEDAKFMLVACTAFVNYAIAKAGKMGIPLS